MMFWSNRILKEQIYKVKVKVDIYRWYNKKIEILDIDIRGGWGRDI